VRGDVLLGHVADDARVDPEEFADVVEGLRGGVDERAVAEDENLLLRETQEEVLQLLAVFAEPGVVPEVSPASGDAGVLLGAGPDEVPGRIEPG
jgi:hypothetical protein